MNLSKKRLTPLYFLLVCLAFLWLFFTNDFSVSDVQKTAIVIAVGIDKKEDEILLTSQISLPNAQQDGNTKTELVTSKGKTVQDALFQVNAKTGWYPKLVFCQLLLLGKEVLTSDVFETLGFFLRDEYLPDDCLVVACAGEASETLGAKTAIDTISGLAVQKILSPSAKRVGTAYPVTLREFAVWHFSDARSGITPQITVQKKQGTATDNAQTGGGENDSKGTQSKQGKQSEEKSDMYEASACALFVDGKMVGTLSKRQTFALCVVQNKLRLADYSLSFKGIEYTLNFRNNRPKTTLKVDENGVPRVRITVKITAGMGDTAKSPTIDELNGPGAIPDGLLAHAETLLKSEIESAYENCRALGCDAFQMVEKLRRFENDYFLAYKDDLLSRAVLSVVVKIDGVR